MRESRGPIDIIVPVYNAYEDLLKCIDSLRKYTDLSFDRLILINDCSPDERIAEYMQSLEKNIVVISNEKNMGFSNNINMGMKYSDDRDVVLLNSDTIVSRGWVDKIVECAYSKEEIGTVTPMSNSATLCSFPNMCQDNPLPEGIELDDLAEVVERCSLKAYPRITVAVGFCMFIKRKTIRDVGFFDAEAFERGYGEENDFCNRAEQMGYIHVMCDDTFIYHKGTVSFMTEQKQRLIEAHDKILQERYPEQMKKNHLYCITNPDQYIRDNIMPYLHVKNGRKNILYLSHLDFIPKAEGSVGGTQFHVRDLTMQLKEKYNVFVMSRDKEYIRLTIYTDKTTDYFMFYVGKPEMFFTFTDSRLREIFASVLDGFEIDIVHVHHTDRMSFDLFYLAHERNIPIAVTLHDYYYICPNVKLYNIEKGYCSGRCDHEECAKCLKDNKNVVTRRNYLNKWRYECKNVLDLSDVIVSPSEAAKKIYASIYPELENKIIVIEHATEIRKKENPHIDNIQRNLNIEYCYDKIKYVGSGVLIIEGWVALKNTDNSDVNIFIKADTGRSNCQMVRCNKNNRDDIAEHFNSNKYIHTGFSCKIFLGKNIQADKVKLSVICEKGGEYFSDLSVQSATLNNVFYDDGRHKIAFVGGLVEEKGAKYAYNLIKNDEKYVWYIIGDIGYEPLLTLEKDNLFKLGRYMVDELPMLTKSLGIELVCVLPVWPETFCYTISEAVLCGLPVLGTDIGAVGDRIKRHRYGWTVPVDTDEKELAGYIDDIFNNEEDFKDKLDKVKGFNEIRLQKMSEQYDELYGSLFRKTTYKKSNTQCVFKALLKDNEFIYKINSSKEEKTCREYENQIEELSNKLNMIEKSRSYRLMKKIKKLIGR